jgi:hypothetical protein
MTEKNEAKQKAALIRAEKLSPQRRSDIAKKAATQRQ